MVAARAYCIGPADQLGLRTGRSGISSESDRSRITVTRSTRPILKHQTRVRLDVTIITDDGLKSGSPHEICGDTHPIESGRSDNTIIKGKPVVVLRTACSSNRAGPTGPVKLGLSLNCSIT